MLPIWKRFPVLVMVLLIFSSANGLCSDFGQPQDLVAKSTTVLQSFMADPNMQWFHQNVSKARGVFIVPQMLRGGFIVGGSGGSGVLLNQNFRTAEWSSPAFYTMGSVSIGLQIGADASEIILMIMTEKGIEAMLSTEFKLGGDVSVAAGPVGKTAKAQTADILAFGRSKGVFGGVSIEGAVITPRDSWNQSYYGKPVAPVDILINQSVHNPGADPLRQLLPQGRSSGKPLGS